MDAASWANLIASVAFLVAVVSAVFAWKSAREARQANKISIHEYQRKLYEAFTEAFHLVKENGMHTDLREFAKITLHIKTSRLYVDEKISADLEKFYEAFIVVYDAECKRKRAYAESAEASKRNLIGGNVSPLAKSISDRADSFAEQCEYDADLALRNLYKIGADLDKRIIEYIKLI
jgi:hypothetical protein